MEVVVDGTTGLGIGPDETSLKAVFESLRKSASSRRRLVVSLTLDGEVLSRERQEALAGSTAAGYSLLEVRTIDPFQISLDTLAGLRAHSENLERAHREAAELVVAGEYQKALRKFDECFHGWDILVRAVCDVGNLTSADFKTLQAGGLPVETGIRKLQDALLRFRTAFELKDVVRIADIVRHELGPLIGEWTGILEALSRHVARASGAAP
jgi:hypothetical protein